MKLICRYLAIVFLGSAWLAAEAAPQAPPTRSSSAAPLARSGVVDNEADYALTLKDPFSPIGYRLPMLEWQAAPPDAPAVSNVPPPSIDLKAKAKTLLRVKGILKRGNTYVANVNGTIVQAGDEVGVTVDGHKIVFVIRAISLKRVEIEPKE